MMKNNVCKRALPVLLAVCMVLSLMVACKKQQPEINCSIEIDCGYIWNHEEDLLESKVEFVPQDGMILAETEVTVEQGDTAFDLLEEICDEQDIHLDAEDGSWGKYVKGIGQIYGGDCGEMSGWMFKINGEYADVGSEVYELAEGDLISWVFICDYEIDQ